MPLTLYPFLLIVAIIIFCILGKKNKIEKEAAVTLTNSSLFKFSVFIKSNGKVIRGYEDDDLGKVGYFIYTKLVKPNYTHEVFISDNSNNELMMIDKNDESESMIGVDHPEHGHIGYLPFISVANI